MASRHPSAPSPIQSLHEEMLRETTTMIRYAMASGRSVPASVVQVVERDMATRHAATPVDLAPLVQAHEKLARIVAPATPRALVLLGGLEGNGMASVMQTVPLVRRLIIAAGTSLVLFILSSLSPQVNRIAGNPINASGLALLTNEVFWLASAALGASFAMLFQINQFITDRTYDSKYEPAYWTKLMLGVIAGLILASLVSVDATGSGTAELAKPTLALLGGFSASAVYRILTRLVESVEAVFQGDPREDAKRQARDAADTAGQAAARHRMRVAASLVDLQQRMAAGASPDEISQTLRTAVRTLTDPSEPDEPAAPPPAAVADVSAPQPAAPDPAPAAAASDGSSPDVSTTDPAADPTASASDAPPADDSQPVAPPGTIAVPAIAQVG